MARLFAEIDRQTTPLGEVVLRRRRIPALTSEDIFEVKLNDEFLMSSLFVAAEEALARLALAEIEGQGLQVVVGGLGLGYTARAALENPRVAELQVVEALEAVIHWHRQELVPLGADLNKDPRCHFRHADFFALARNEDGGFAGKGGLDAILLDIDHSPDAHLNSANAGFYLPENLEKLALQLKPHGIFAMWSNDEPDPAFMARLEQVFPRVTSEAVSFYNPFQDQNSRNTVYLARR